jgi:uncharacterized protein HemY
MRDPTKRSVQRGATTMLNAMQNYGHGRFAMVESLVGEKPHAAVVAATEENPALLRAILRLVKRHAARAPGSDEGAKS